jgi:hypothetical protein
VKASGTTLSEVELRNELDHWMPGNRPIFINESHPVQRVTVSGTQVLLDVDDLNVDYDEDDQCDCDPAGDRAVELLTQLLNGDIGIVEFVDQAKALIL